MGVVARRTGLKPDLVRAWERRYGAVEPSRTSGGQRAYSDADIERLSLLRQATEGGHPIRRIARLPAAELRRLVAEDRRLPAVRTPAPTLAGGGTAEERLAACLAAVERLDPRALAGLLEGSTLHLSRQRLLDDLVVPLMERVGEGWREGVLRPFHEHLATAVVRSLLAVLQDGRGRSLSGPQLLVTTPAGQRHELGALLAAVAADAEGWEVTYLGPDLPAEEIAAAAHAAGARAVALGITYPPDDPGLVRELRTLGRLLGTDLPLAVGGRAAAAHGQVLAEIGARPVDNLASFRELLRKLRLPAPRSGP